MKAFTLINPSVSRVSEFGKVEVTSTPAESSFLGPLPLLTGLYYNMYSEFIIPPKILMGGCQDIF
jgi:hypothetical protein